MFVDSGFVIPIIESTFWETWMYRSHNLYVGVHTVMCKQTLAWTFQRNSIITASCGVLATAWLSCIWHKTCDFSLKFSSFSRFPLTTFPFLVCYALLQFNQCPIFVVKCKQSASDSHIICHTTADSHHFNMHRIHSHNTITNKWEKLWKPSHQ